MPTGEIRMYLRSLVKQLGGCQGLVVLIRKLLHCLRPTWSVERNNGLLRHTTRIPVEKAAARETSLPRSLRPAMMIPVEKEKGHQKTDHPPTTARVKVGKETANLQRSHQNQASRRMERVKAKVARTQNQKAPSGPAAAMVQEVRRWVERNYVLNDDFPASSI